jgi:hypothetical protein
VTSAQLALLLVENDCPRSPFRIDVGQDLHAKAPGTIVHQYEVSSTPARYPVEVSAEGNGSDSAFYRAERELARHLHVDDVAVNRFTIAVRYESLN